MAAIAILALISTAATAAETVRVKLSKGAEFQMPIPEHWKATTSSSAEGKTLRITPTDEKDFVILITILPVPANSPMSSADTFAELLRRRGTKELEGAMQDRLEWIELKGDSASVYLYHLTDRNPEKGPGDYREAHQGGVHLGSHLASVTILTHPGGEAIVELAKDALKSAKIVQK